MNFHKKTGLPLFTELPRRWSSRKLILYRLKNVA
jgi:hypothetical protein